MRWSTGEVKRRSILLGAPALLLPSRGKPALAVTIDDIAWRSIPEPWRDLAADTLLATLERHNVRAMLFVAGSNVDDAEGKTLLQRWNDAGHWLGNHTYEHRRLGRANSAMPWYGEDILQCDELLRGNRDSANTSAFRRSMRETPPPSVTQYELSCASTGTAMDGSRSTRPTGTTTRGCASG
jgi:peptidoglycan/xylan/chitin deacetylase (PgdA/CDA1 family)